MVAGYAAKQLVELGVKPGELTILSADSAIPYERPPLSKGFLAGKDTEESVRINGADFYREHGIELRLNCLVSSVDPERRRVILDSGAEFGFERLVLATGARPRTLTVAGATPGNILYLRSLDDSKAIRQHVSGTKKAVVIGGGFIGMEVASVLAQKAIHTTMIFPEDRVWKQFFTPEMSAFFEGYFGSRGVRFQKGASAGEIRDATAIGGADLVIAGIGAIPNTEAFAGSGIDVENGVVVNEYLETNRPEILAAGDIANYPDLLFNKRRRVEHWDNAVSQGQHCAKALMGERTPFRHVPYFFSDVFDLSYEFWGDPGGAEQIVHRGDLTSNSFSVWWLRQSKLIAALAMNRPDEEREAAPKWIEARQAVASSKLQNESTPIQSAAEA